MQIRARTPATGDLGPDVAPAPFALSEEDSGRKDGRLRCDFFPPFLAICKRNEGVLICCCCHVQMNNDRLNLQTSLISFEGGEVD